MSLGTNFSLWSNEIIVRVLSPQSIEDVSQDYYYGLLEKALVNGNGSKYKLKVIDASNLTQGRSMQLLAENFLDVYWMGDSKIREDRFRAIKIPLMKGLLGYRVSIVKKDNLNELTSLSESQFKQKIACQGEHWPDTQILRHNQYVVNPVARYDLMFGMLSKGRCDYFPRAVFEGYGELAVAQQELKNITVLDDVILYYPFPIYFFVNKTNTELGNVIETGLEQMIDSGEFDEFIKTHNVTKHVFPLEKWQKKKIFQLSNPFLPDDTDINNSRYWLRPAK